MSTCTGCVLAGGSGSRLGGVPKGLLEVGGRRILDRVLDAISGACDALLLVSNDPAAAEWAPAIPVVADVRSERGALVGIHAALAHAGGAVIVAAWDMPFLRVDLLLTLRALGERCRCAAIPESLDGRQALCAYYPPEARTTAELLLARGERRVGAFVDALSEVAALSAAEVARFGDPKRIFFNVNTPHDLATARRLAGSGEAGTGSSAD